MSEGLHYVPNEYIEGLKGDAEDVAEYSAEGADDLLESEFSVECQQVLDSFKNAIEQWNNAEELQPAENIDLRDLAPGEKILMVVAAGERAPADKQMAVIAVGPGDKGYLQVEVNARDMSQEISDRIDMEEREYGKIITPPIISTGSYEVLLGVFDDDMPPEHMGVGYTRQKYSEPLTEQIRVGGDWRNPKYETRTYDSVDLSVSGIDVTNPDGGFEAATMEFQMPVEDFVTYRVTKTVEGNSVRPGIIVRGADYALHGEITNNHFERGERDGETYVDITEVFSELGIDAYLPEGFAQPDALGVQREKVVHMRKYVESTN